MPAAAPEPAGAPTALVDVAGVAVGFGGVSVLSDVTLTISDGEIVTLIGPNGSGKTTLVRVMLGLLKPDRGRVRLRAGTRVGYMPQRVTVDETLPLTVARFLSLGSRGSADRIGESLDEVGAAEVADRPVQRLSGGEFQRVLLARALLREPQLLVLDEPAQGVDVTGRGEFFTLLARVRESRGCSVLLVSHDLHLVMAATDTVVCLNHHICCTGRPEAVSRHPEYLALFGPLAAEGLAVYTHEHDHTHDASGEVVAQESGRGDGEREDLGHG